MAPSFSPTRVAEAWCTEPILNKWQINEFVFMKNASFLEIYEYQRNKDKQLLPIVTQDV